MQQDFLRKRPVGFPAHLGSRASRLTKSVGLWGWGRVSDGFQGRPIFVDNIM